MNPTTLRVTRQRMHLPIRSLGRWYGCAESSIRQMEAGTRPIPAPFAEWMNRLGEWVERNPPPARVVRKVAAPKMTCGVGGEVVG